MFSQKQLYSDRGVKMAYWEIGEGTPLLFLHGAGATVLTYEKTIEKLAQSYHVIAPDVPCFGESDVPKEVWGMEDFAHYFDGFIRSKHLHDLIVVGHSFGGGIAFHLATVNHTLKKVIVVNPAGFPVDRSTLKQAYLFFVRKTISELLEEKEINTLKSMSRQFGRNIKLHFKELPQIFRIIKRCLWDKELHFEKITTPTTIIWGKKDVVFPVSYAEGLHQAIPSSRLIYVNGAHSWALFNPTSFLEKFNEAVL